VPSAPLACGVVLYSGVLEPAPAGWAWVLGQAAIELFVPLHVGTQSCGDVVGDDRDPSAEGFTFFLGLIHQPNHFRLEASVDGPKGRAIIDLEEIRAIKNKYLTFFERVFAFILNQSPERMMFLCDHDKDGFISRDDFAKATDTCLKECMKRGLFWKKICLPASAEEHERIERERAEHIKKLEQQIAGQE